MEAEYIALSQSMRKTIPFLNLMEEIGMVLDVLNPKPKIHCKVFEDNMSCIKVAESPKFTPLAIKYHHFCKHVDLMEIN
jgi:dihydroorotase